MDTKENKIVEVRDVSFHYETSLKTNWMAGLGIKKLIKENKLALDHVNFQMKESKITALLGRNGSGKTTLIKIITGARLPSEGEVYVLNSPPHKVRNQIGLFLGNTLIYHRLTARENLEYFGRLYGVENLENKIYELSHWLEIDNNLDHLVETFSFGMKVKLALARAMIHSPKLLILDEPTLGIDLPLARQIRSMVRSLSCSILLTTHYMEEAEELADDICLIDKGKILTQGSKKDVLELFKCNTVPQLFQKMVGA